MILVRVPARYKLDCSIGLDQVYILVRSELKMQERYKLARYGLLIWLDVATSWINKGFIAVKCLMRQRAP